MKQLFGKTMLSVVKDPFNAKSIEKISMYCYKSMIDGKFSFNGYVAFNNNNTEGKQNFTASNLGELFMKISDFCKSLE